MELKVCGITTTEDIMELIPMDISRLGFIFYHMSKRYVYGKLIEDGLKEIPTHIKKTGVFQIGEGDKQPGGYTGL